LTPGQFRFAYYTPLYEATVEFYRDGFGLPALETWDRGPGDRGTLFGAAAGIIEVLELPSERNAPHVFDGRSPQGAFMVIELEDVEGLYARALEKRLPITQELTDQPWGHRNFCVTDPNGLTLFFFREIPSR
jgi:catechol 2,3-dioxygenase-like lactoylglutathione lyase family enzyme